MKTCQFQLVNDFVSSSSSLLPSALDKVLVLNARTWTKKTLKQQSYSQWLGFVFNLKGSGDAAELFTRPNDLKIEFLQIIVHSWKIS